MTRHPRIAGLWKTLALESYRWVWFLQRVPERRGPRSASGGGDVAGGGPATSFPAYGDRSSFVAPRTPVRS